MARIAAHLVRSHSGGDSVSDRYSLPFPPTSWDLGPCQYVFGVNSALNQHTRELISAQQRSHKHNTDKDLSRLR